MAAQLLKTDPVSAKALQAGGQIGQEGIRNAGVPGGSAGRRCAEPSQGTSRRREGVFSSPEICDGKTARRFPQGSP